jgi:cobalt-zinc-cadmium efflux system outer membrane protein
MNAPLIIAFAMLAQERGAESRALSEVFRDVEANSPALVGERAAVAAATRRAAASGAWADPFVAFGPDEYAFDASPPMLRFEVSQAIPLPGTLSPTVDAANAEARASQAGVEVTTRSLRVMALELFLRGLHVTASLAALETQQRLLDDIMAAAQARYAAGGTGQRDVLLAAAERPSSNKRRSFRGAS